MLVLKEYKETNETQLKNYRIFLKQTVLNYYWEKRIIDEIKALERINIRVNFLSHRDKLKLLNPDKLEIKSKINAN